MEKKVTIGNKEYTIKEILAVDVDDVDWKNAKETQKALVLKGSSVSSEDYQKLTLKERIYLLKEINELNGFGDFQETSNEKKD